MLRLAVLAFVLTSMSALWSGSAFAQWGPPPWDNDRNYRDYPYPYQYQKPSYGFPPGRDWDEDDDFPPRFGSAIRSGGPRPEIAPVAPGRVAFPSSYPVGSIVIDHKGRQLFLVESPTQALRYPISVGREGFSWTGTEKISRTVNWPDWHPPEEMRERDPDLPEHMRGGLNNPLGAKALYLGNTLYRIHGTNDPKSIGRAASSGCFRMLNGHVIDLASRVSIGTPVTVVSRLPPELERVVTEQVRRGAMRAPPARARGPLEHDPTDMPAGEGAGANDRRRS
ncbi:MAG: L,D-transpeptidase [Hyphomicrobiaceae bacterium]|nr:L,D-transpeptidase [Hyphomicrobiaceae bacterium]